MGVSPDGIIDYTNAAGQKCRALLEIKCPIKYAEPDKHELHGGKSPYDYYGPMKRFKSPVDGVPPYYYDQVQGIMGYLNRFKTPLGSSDIKFCDFVVWSPPDHMWITRVPFDQVYFDRMFEQLRDVYFTEILPRFVERDGTSSTSICATSED
jgi:hypothetical protein